MGVHTRAADVLEGDVLMNLNLFIINSFREHA